MRMRRRVPGASPNPSARGDGTAAWPGAVTCLLQSSERRSGDVIVVHGLYDSKHSRVRVTAEF